MLRLHRARGDERQQLKWFAYAATLLAAGFITLSTTDGESSIGAAPLVAGLVALPLAIGIAIFRYRLYEIDVIIRRRSSTAPSPPGLAGLYFGIVLALQQIFSSFAGGSDLAVAVSTLAVAALFGPARRRIQTAVDRRFYRRKYDAQRTLEAFSGRLRQEVDLDTLRTELVAVVDETMRPTGVSLWLKEVGMSTRAPAARLARLLLLVTVLVVLGLVALALARRARRLATSQPSEQVLGPDILLVLTFAVVGADR